MSAFEVTFRITRPAAWSAEKPGPTYEEYLQGLARIVYAAVTGRAQVATEGAWSDWWRETEAPLVAGEAVRMSLSGDAFARFFILRRAAGGDAPRRLNWSDAVEVEG